MKWRRYFTLKKGHQIISMLVVAAFVFITCSQFIHAHVANPVIKVGTEDIIVTSEKCEICDFIVHKQTKLIIDAHPVCLIFAIPEPITYDCGSCISNYDFTLQGFTNKGPPVALS